MQTARDQIEAIVKRGTRTRGEEVDLLVQMNLALADELDAIIIDQAGRAHAFAQALDELATRIERVEQREGGDQR